MVNATSLDVAVVGAGFVGSLVAIKAAELGLSVRAFDLQAEYPPRFRAEKLETDQYEGLERLGLIDLVEPRGSPLVDQVVVFRGKTRKVVRCTKHRGMDYQATVNRLRAHLKTLAPLSIGPISKVEDTRQGTRITDAEGGAWTARLAVAATGASVFMRNALALAPPAPGTMISTSIGFFVRPETSGDFCMEAFNAYPSRFVPGLQYATFFPVGNETRVNVFTCWPPAGSEARAFRRDPIASLRRYFPVLDDAVGPMALSSTPQLVTTEYYRQNTDHLTSTVLVGDEYQSVSPATGMGISKCVTDAEVLTGLLPQLVKDPSARLDLSAFYNDPRKQVVDEKAHSSWAWSNNVSTDRSMGMRFKIAKQSLKGMLVQ